MAKYGEAVVLVLLGLPTALIDWQIASTWRLAPWISLLAGSVALGGLALVVLVPRLRALGSATVVALLYALPIIGGIVRLRLVPSPTTLIGDGAFQMQTARDVLMRGTDPYGFNYVGTGMERTPWGQSFPNPALHHLDYWPGTLVVPLPVQAAFKAAFGWWDERIWLLLAAAAIWVLLGTVGAAPFGRMAAIAFFLIPGHTLLAVLGDNDLPMVMLLLAGVLAMAQRRWFVAALFIGLGIATKQTALIALPVLVLWAFAFGIERRRFLQALAIATGTVALLLLPFLIWNSQSFIKDTILFNFGSGTETYPIQGLGLSAMLLQLGVIHGSRDAFPFLLVQLPLVIGAWLLAWRWFRSRRQPGDAILWMGIAFFVFLFANRFSQQAYLLLGVQLMLAGLLSRMMNSPAAAGGAQPVPAAA